MMEEIATQEQYDVYNKEFYRLANDQDVEGNTQKALEIIDLIARWEKRQDNVKVVYRSTPEPLNIRDVAPLVFDFFNPFKL
jgi:hypothetical protein